MIAKQGNVADTYSLELERIRRLELRTGGTPEGTTSWFPFLFQGGIGGTPVGYYRIHYNAVFIAGELPTPISGVEDPDTPGWLTAGVLPESATPPVEHLVWAAVVPVSIMPGDFPFYPLAARVRVDGRVQHLSSEVFLSGGTYFFTQGTPTFPLVTSYFPLG